MKNTTVSISGKTPQFHGTFTGLKNACSYADLVMGIVDQKGLPNANYAGGTDIFDLRTQGTTKLNELSAFTNSLHSTINLSLLW